MPRKQHAKVFIAVSCGLLAVSVAIGLMYAISLTVENPVPAFALSFLLGGTVIFGYKDIIAPEIGHLLDEW